MKSCACFPMTLALVVAISGCGQSGPTLVPVTGVVTYKGDPVGEASVSFQPEEGPISTGTTDATGKFTLASKDEEGAVIGPGVFTVRAMEAGDTSIAEGEVIMPGAGEEGNQADMMVQATNAPPPKSRIPVKYSIPTSSDLKFTIDSDAAKNNFTLELKD